MLIDFSTVANCIVGIGGSCVERREASETKKLILGQGVDLPFVTLRLVRGTTALEVNAPPDHYSFSIRVCSGSLVYQYCMLPSGSRCSGIGRPDMCQLVCC